jgi:hypothetical protein
MGKISTPTWPWTCKAMPNDDHTEITINCLV